MSAIDVMIYTAQNFFIKCNQIGSFLRILWHFLKKNLKENFIFFGVLLMMSMNLSIIIILNIKSSDYHYIIRFISKNEVIKSGTLENIKN